MRALLTRLILAVALTVSGFAATGAPFTGQQVQGISDPRSITGLAAWYDISDLSSLIYDGSNRVALVADKSGNSSVNVLALNGVAGNYASSPDSAAVSFTADIDVATDIMANDYTPTGNQLLIAKGTSVVPANMEYALQLNTGGTLTLYWSTGAATLSATSTAAVSFTDLSRGSVRATLDADNGAAGYTVTFYTGTTFGTWSQLGSTVVGGAPTSVQNSANALAVGSFTGGVSGNFAGVVYRATLTGTISGTLVFDANFATASKLATSFTESSSNAATVTINTSGDTGARICGARDLYQGTVAKQPVYLPWSGTNYGWFNGGTSISISAPSQTSFDIAGDIELIAKVAARNYAPGSVQTIAAKWITGNYSYFFGLTAGGGVQLFWNPTGSGAFIGGVSTAALPTASGADVYLRATLDADNGAGGNTTTFYTSTDGASWTQLGAPVVNAGVTSLYVGTSELSIGREPAGALQPFTGKIYSVKIYNGIGGTLAADFDASRYTSGTTVASPSGETWTLNGGSTIVTRTCLYFDGSNDYLKAAAFAQPQPVSRLTVGSHITWTSGDYLWDGASAANTGAIIQTTSTPQLNMSAGSSVAANTDFTLNTNFIFTEIVNGASSSLQANKLTATTGNAGAGVPNGITIGASGASTAANFGNITFSECVSYGSLTAAQVIAVQQYLARKWSISGGFAFTAPTPSLPIPRICEIIPIRANIWKDELAA
jgi:hypothetical protein